MGNNNSIQDSSSSREAELTPPRIVINERVTLREKTRTRFVLVIAMCCSTVINTVEPEPGAEEAGATEDSERQRPVSSGLAVTQVIVPPPKKPLNSRPRIRRYGYRFTAKVDPLILSPDDLEEISMFGQDIIKEQEDAVQTDLGRWVKLSFFHKQDKKLFTEASVEKIINADKRVDEKEQKELDKSEKDLERIRARSAVINTVGNEIQRRKMNTLRLLQAKKKREEDKLRLKQNLKS